MTAPYEIGDIVKPKPNYERCATVCGQRCKCNIDKNWLYHLFKTAEIIFIHENGNVDLTRIRTSSRSTTFRLKCLKRHRTIGRTNKIK